MKFKILSIDGNCVEFEAQGALEELSDAAIGWAQKKLGHGGPAPLGIWREKKEGTAGEWIVQWGIEK